VNVCSLPRPVSGSGVRFAVKLTPHGPEKAVFVGAATMSQGPAGVTAGSVIERLSGWPDSMRLMSGSAPFGVGFHGVWQSLQPDVVTRYLPRATVSPFWSANAGCAAMAATHVNKANIPGRARIDRFIA
jgi:hypothetical protein